MLLSLGQPPPRRNLLLYHPWVPWFYTGPPHREQEPQAIYPQVPAARRHHPLPSSAFSVWHVPSHRAGQLPPFVFPSLGSTAYLYSSSSLLPLRKSYWSGGPDALLQPEMRSLSIWLPGHPLLAGSLAPKCRHRTTAPDIFRSLKNCMCGITGHPRGQQQLRELSFSPLVPSCPREPVGMVCFESGLFPAEVMNFLFLFCPSLD